MAMADLPPERRLVPGAAPLTLAVDPRPHHVPTGLLVQPGERYRFAATGTWCDWWICRGPAGWGGGWLNRAARLPWFSLFMPCGSIGQDDAQAFAIGATLDWTVPASAAGLENRTLCLFANDLPWMYGNNRPATAAEGGPLRVTITRPA